MKTSCFRLMKSPETLTAAIVVFLTAVMPERTANAGDVIRADNTSALNLPGAWVGGSVPGSGDVAVWDSTVTANRSSAIGGNLSWSGIRIGNTGGTLMTIGSTAGSVLDLGSAGIDMSAANADLTLSAVTNFSANQSWSIASGRTLQLNPTTSNTGSASISVTGPGNLVLANGTAQMGTGTVTIGGGLRITSNGATGRTINNNLILSGDIGIGSTTIAGPITLASNSIDLGGGTRTISLQNSVTDGSATTLTIGSTTSVVSVTGGTLALVNGNASGTIRVFLGIGGGSFIPSISSNLNVGANVVAALPQSNVLSSSADLTVDGRLRLGNLSSASSSNTVKSLSGSGAIDSGQASGTNIGTLAINGGASTGTTTFSGVIENGAFGFVAINKSGSNTQVLSGANTYSGGTTINAGTLVAIGDTANVLLSTGAFTLAGGTFNYKSTNGNINSQTIGTVAVTTNANTIQSEETGAGTSTLTIGALTRTAGATVNFVTTGAGAAIKSTSAITPAITLAKGVFYNGDYATATAGGTVSAINYGVTANTHSVSGAIGTPVIGDFYNLTGDASAVSGANFGAAGTIRFGGNYTYTATGANSVGGYLTNGATAAVISGSGTLRAGGEVVFATNGSSDTLTTSNAITQFNNTSNLANNTSVTKSGAGKLVIGGNNTYYGDTYINQGTFQTTSATGLGFGGTMGAVNQGTGKTTVSAGATLDLSPASAMTVNEAITLRGGASLMNSGSGTTTIDNGVASVNLTALGSGGTANSGTVLIAGGTSNATANITVVSGAITAFTETAAGSGYTSTPNVTFTIAGQTTPSAATAILSSLTLNGENTIGGSGNIVIKAVVANGTSAGGFSKTGNGDLTLSAANTYTGATTVTAGTLIVNGSVASSSGVSVGGSGTLKGSGTVSSISGAGLVSVGNSPGILTATQVDGSSGLDFTFEFTLAGSPTYSSAAASGNDVLHLTNATPFVLALNSGNTVTVDFSGASLSLGQKYRGGFFTDKTDTSNSLINGATFSYAGTGAYTVQYNGLVTEASAGFASGTVTNGLVMEFEIVPEPATWALLAFSLTTVMILRRRRSA